MVLNNLKKIFFKGKKYNKKQIKHSLDNIIKVSTFISSNKKFNISDNFYSRYEIILIFIYLLYKRFKNDETNKERLQILYDFLFEYIDYSLREIGVGDLSVGKKVKTLARIFSYRMTTYDKSIILGFNNIKKPIKKFVFKDKVKKNDLDNFYKYINMQDNKLNSLKSEKIFIKYLFNEPK
ncbi:MAG: hypothetical protein CMI97_04215 [Pelagibacteraceae bacterium]|nr:hypothetical protein [Pelagibacteraceae bacterium]|tara:strand:- start:15869 stop:16408 length:540 start_codon:yes stop_codon:yes gene_type:complete